MVLSDRFAGKPRPSLAKRTLLYVLGFGLGSLAFVGIVSLIMVSVTEGIFPAPKGPKDKSAVSDKTTDDDGDKKTKKPTSKARRPRGNEPSDDRGDTPL